MAAFFGERARAGVAMMITGGFSPDAEGAATEGRGIFDSAADVAAHRQITHEVHAGGGLILLQVLHAGGYARHGHAVAASALPTPFCPVVPKMLDEDGIERAIENHVRCARLAREAGYDGVEILGAGGYLINGFFAPRTNHRKDRWGGDTAHRARLALEIVRRTRKVMGTDFLIGFRLSLADFVEGGNTWADTVWLAQSLEKAGVDYLGSTFGWHESPVPTIAGVVPPAAFSFLTRRLRDAVSIPVVASNRINTPEQAEALLARGEADLVALARPLLADPQFVSKTEAGLSESINTCIACNQACLDRTFSQGVVSCLVNPRACHETQWEARKAERTMSIAVVGAGMAGLSCAVALAERGHQVTLHEAAAAIGGQFRLAANVPGKEDYSRTLAYFMRRLQETGVALRLGSTPTADALSTYDHVVIATGVLPRMRSNVSWASHPMVMGYDELLSGRRQAGRRVLVVGAGGIAFDAAEYLTQEGVDDAASFMVAWGIDPDGSVAGGLGVPREAVGNDHRHVLMLQRGAGKPGRALGRTTGWIKRRMLERRGVKILTNAVVESLDDAGVRIRVDGVIHRWDADTVVLCTGQTASDDLSASLKAMGTLVSVIGGALDSEGIDAERAIRQGMHLGSTL